MFCHAPHAQGVCSAARPGTRASFPVGVPGIPPASSLSASSAWVLPPCSRFVPSVPPPRCCGGTLFRAYRAGAGGRVSAGAVRAPDCAREFSGRTSPVGSRRGFFEAPATLLRRKAKGGPGSRLSTLIIAHFSPGQASRRAKYEIFPISCRGTRGPQASGVRVVVP